MKHIASIEIKDNNWHNLKNLVRVYKGNSFDFEVGSVYRIQNVGYNTLMIVDSGVELENTSYEEGIVLSCREHIEYNKKDGDFDIYVRTKDSKVTITEM